MTSIGIFGVPHALFEISLSVPDAALCRRLARLQCAEPPHFMHVFSFPVQHTDRNTLPTHTHIGTWGNIPAAGLPSRPIKASRWQHCDRPTSPACFDRSPLSLR